MKVLIVLLLCLAFPTLAICNDTKGLPPVKPQTDKEIILQAIKKYAEEYQVSAYQLERTIECESGFKSIQSNIIKNGQRELSFGIAQIHLPSHPDISQSQALDVDFSVEFMAKEFSKGNAWKWYGYKSSVDSCSYLI